MKVRRFFLRLLPRLGIFVLSVLLLSVLTFYISRLAPGDPLVSYYGDRVEKMSPAEREWAEDKLGLNDPLPTQYARWFSRALHGDFGISYKYKMDVLELIGDRIGNTLLLGGLGFVLLFVLALLLGALCAWKEDRPLDRILCKLGTVTSCIPEFWLSLMLILLFSVTLRWLPSSGAYSVGHADDIGDRIVHLILPMSVVVLSHLWYYAYLVRNRLVEELRADYVLLARSEGMGRAHIVLRQCLRNVLPSYLSLMAISVPHVMGGTYIVEAVFSYPGLGTLSYESARYKDYNLLMVLCLLSGAVVIACSLLAQAMNARLDPAPSPGGTGGDLKMTDDRFRLVGVRPQSPQHRYAARRGTAASPIFSAAVLALIVLGCLFCEALLTHDPTYLDLAHCNEAPSREFLFGDGPDGPRYFLHDLVRAGAFR